MRYFPIRIGRGLVAGLVLFGVLLGICAIPADAGVCEQALYLCLFEDQEIRMNMLMFFIPYCIEGYAFCKKYIDPSGD
jgi:hypothetical protein